MTRCAGRFTPMANVVVVMSIGRFPQRNVSSVILRSSTGIPAWWMLIPMGSISFTLLSINFAEAEYRSCRCCGFRLMLKFCIKCLAVISTFLRVEQKIWGKDKNHLVSAKLLNFQKLVSIIVGSGWYFIFTLGKLNLFWNYSDYIKLYCKAPADVSTWNFASTICFISLLLFIMKTLKNKLIYR